MLAVKRRAGGVAAWLLTLALALMSALPIIWIALTAFKTFIETQAVPPVWPNLTDFTNFTTEFGGASSGVGPLQRSLIVASATTLLTLVVAIPAAYSLARYRIVRKADIQFWIISTRMMPLIAAIIPLAILLRDLGLFDTVQGLVIVYTGINLSFAVWLLTIFFQSVPEEIEQAALIDGVTKIGVLWRISIPMSLSSIFVVALFTWIFSWNELISALVLTSGETQTLPVFLSRFASNTLLQWQQMAAVATIQVIPAIIITFAAQRYVVSGLSMGALSAE